MPDNQKTPDEGRTFTLVDQPKNICVDFDSDCLCVDNHLSCWVYDQKRGFCPYLNDVGKMLATRRT
jgi:hypothetical protein